MKRDPRIMLVAGETSGDHHGAQLVSALRRARPKAVFFGLGGDALRRAGMRLDLDLASHAVIGFVEVLKHLPFFWWAFRLAVASLKNERPDLLILIDYPGFNLRLAKVAKSLGIPVCYYISPQVWAWKRGRVKLMAKIIDRMLVTFPFEKTLYDAAGLDCVFVGNPLVDAVKPSRGRLSFRRRAGWKTSEKVVGLLPGSRLQELKHLLPVMLATAQRMRTLDPRCRFVVIKAPQLPLASYAKIIEASPIQPKIFEWTVAEEAYSARAACDFALVASGTATLETAMLGVPFLILYRVNALTYWIGKRLVKIHSIGLANVMAGRRVVPEFLQEELRPQAIANEAIRYLHDPALAKAQRRALAPSLRSLGKQGVSARAAKAVLELVDLD